MTTEFLALEHARANGVIDHNRISLSSEAAKELLEYRNGVVVIHPCHNKLIISLRTAIENGEESLVKETNSHDDL